MGKTAAEVIKKLLEMGIRLLINQELDADTAILVLRFRITVEVKLIKTVEIMEDIQDDNVCCRKDRRLSV